MSCMFIGHAVPFHLVFMFKVTFLSLVGGGGRGQEISFFLNDKQWILDLEKYILPPPPQFPQFVHALFSVFGIVDDENSL